MIYVNTLSAYPEITKKEFETLLLLLAPFAPHAAEELWMSIGHDTSIHREAWPIFDENKLRAPEVTIAVQVNGKLRATFTAAASLSEAEAFEKALNLPEIQKWVGDKSVEKRIYVPQKLVNLVIS